MGVPRASQQGSRSTGSPRAPHTGANFAASDVAELREAEIAQAEQQVQVVRVHLADEPGGTRLSSDTQSNNADSQTELFTEFRSYFFLVVAPRTGFEPVLPP